LKSKLFTIITIAIILITITAQFIYAHSTYQSSIISWGESIGWGIDETAHTATNSFTYKFNTSDRYLTDEYKTLVRNGASTWNSYGTITENSSSGMVLIYTYAGGSSGVVALTTNRVPGAQGHLISCEIKFNRYYSFTATTAAHEFGHVFGLVDLYNYENLYQLMYNSEERLATAPSQQDIKGQKVITGVHSAHNSWAYKRIPGYSYSIPAHRHYCTACDGFKDETCTPTTGTCTKCGYSH